MIILQRPEEWFYLVSELDCPWCYAPFWNIAWVDPLISVCKNCNRSVSNNTITFKGTTCHHHFR